MSLVGFKAQNHPQQVDKRGARAVVDDRTTHPDDFARWHARFGFTIDAAASAANARLPRFWTAEDDALSRWWLGERVWCNPPYSNLEPWVAKANREWWSRRPRLIVMLLPANRTEQGWWQREVERYRFDEDGPRVEFLPGRLRFIRPGQSDVGPNERPPFGCCLVIWGSDVPHS